MEALTILKQDNKRFSVPKPDLILLDLNLPKKNGFEVLAEIKQDDELKVIPVIVLTTSKSDEDVLKSYQLSANCYITKPVDYHSFIDSITGHDVPGGASIIDTPP